MENHFKNIVFINLLLYIIWFFLPEFEPKLNQEEYDALSWIGYGAKIQNSFLFDYAIFFAYCFTSLGLLYFKPWAKKAFIVLVLYSISYSLTSGIMVGLPIDNFLGYLITLSDGAILCLLLLTPISNTFNKSRQQAPSAQDKH